MQTVQTRVSYRIPLVGGTTDYPDYYREFGAQSICCPIDKYLYVSIGKNGQGGLNIQSKADLPWGTGLGSSGAFHSALVLAFARDRKQKLSPLVVANLAYELETGIDPYATGRQDSLACLFTGVCEFKYHRDDSVSVHRIAIPAAWRKKLSDRLLLFDSGVRRRARDSIKDILARKNKSLLHEIAKLPGLLISAWSKGDMDYLGTALDLQEQYRSRLSPTCRSPRTDKLLDVARKCGAGARLTGAGIGCVLCYCPEEKQSELRRKLGLKEIPISILW
jgi:D-glycero-alpha-D-manno-heptose-7-phosphate kinase